jgi:uncharacterized protein (DUF2141 family)
MKKITLTLIIWTTTVSLLGNNSTNLTVTITGIKEIKGTLMVALPRAHEFKEKWHKGIAGKKVKVTDSTMTITFSGLTLNSYYAVKVIQDINDNGILDKNLVGYPLEPYGFSKNPSTLLGPPTWKQVRILLTGKTNRITVRLK